MKGFMSLVPDTPKQLAHCYNYLRGMKWITISISKLKWHITSLLTYLFDILKRIDFGIEIQNYDNGNRKIRKSVMKIHVHLNNSRWYVRETLSVSKQFGTLDISYNSVKYWEIRQYDIAAIS